MSLPAHASPRISPSITPQEEHETFDPTSAIWDDDYVAQLRLPIAAESGIGETDSVQRLQNPRRQSFAVDTRSNTDGLATPPLLARLPKVECQVRARIPTTTGTEMYLHLYSNDVDNKEHLAIVFGDNPAIYSRSLYAERPGDTEAERMKRGAYAGKLHPGRTSSRPERIQEENKSESGRMSPMLQNMHRRQHSQQSQDVRPTQPPQASTSVDPLPTSAIAYPSHSSPNIWDDDFPGFEEGRPNMSSSFSSLHLDSTEHTPQFTHVQERQPTDDPPLVRIHSECYTGETVWSARCDCGEQLDEAARLMSAPADPRSPASPSGGVIVYLRQEGRGIGLGEKLKAYNLQDLGFDTLEANLLLLHPADARSYGLATSLLLDLGLGGELGIRLLTNNPDKIRAVEGPNREVRVRERVAMVPLAWSTQGKGVKGKEVEAYLSTKIAKFGHMLTREHPV